MREKTLLILGVNMDFKQWVDLFGCNVDDKRLRDAMVKAGISETPQIETDETDVRISINGGSMILIFIDETLLNSQALVSGPAVFAGILMIVQHAKMKTLYKGSLPFELQLKNSQDDLRIRFGKTLDNDDEFLWDQWLIDNLNLTVTYSKDLKSLNRVSVQLPEEE